MKKRIAILGSTGSIGTQTLEVVDKNSDIFEVEVLTANNKADLLIEQARKFRPNAVVIGHACYYDKINDALSDLDIKVYVGADAISQVTRMDTIDIILIALVGFAGLEPTIEAVKTGKKIALANKECLVVAGELITRLVTEYKATIVPVDSEHSAIFQCLTGEKTDSVEKIILTASGGPFRNHSMDELKSVTKKEALNHPNWNMGNKITIDSATMINKGLEVIEARWLFGLTPEQIEVIIHPQSIIHSLVQFCDGSVKAQLSFPDMRFPILYALSYPDRIKSDFKRFDFSDFKEFTFEFPDIKKFRNLALAFEALKTGGNLPCVLNAANETAVRAFLNDELNFLDISNVIEDTIHAVKPTKLNSLGEITMCDKEAREISKRFVRKYSL